MSQARLYAVKVQRTWQGRDYNPPASGEKTVDYELLAYTAEDAYFEACRRLSLGRDGHRAWAALGALGEIHVVSVEPLAQVEGGPAEHPQGEEQAHPEGAAGQLGHRRPTLDGAEDEDPEKADQDAQVVHPHSVGLPGEEGKGSPWSMPAWAAGDRVRPTLEHWTRLIKIFTRKADALEAIRRECPWVKEPRAYQVNIVVVGPGES